MPPAKNPTYIPISIEYDGTQRRGSYYVEKKVVTVSAEWGTVSTQVGGSPAELLAKIMLREILDGAKARGDL